jgi:hypothetical protein
MRLRGADDVALLQKIVLEFEFLRHYYVIEGLPLVPNILLTQVRHIHDHARIV